MFSKSKGDHGLGIEASRHEQVLVPQAAVGHRGRWLKVERVGVEHAVLDVLADVLHLLFLLPTERESGSTELQGMFSNEASHYVVFIVGVRFRIEALSEQVGFCSDKNYWSRHILWRLAFVELDLF